MKLLVIDDEPDLLEVMSEILRRHGHNVTAVSTARAGSLALCFDPPYDLAIVDGLAGDGLGLLEEAKAYGVPAILYSSMDDTVDEARSNGHRALLKSGNIPDLLAMLESPVAAR